MAESLAHRWGQILGDLLEASLLPHLSAVAGKHGLYLDRKQKRPCREGVKCTWTDKYGNSHDLDYVLERGGTAEKKGTPVAFIETAWRRYTKHSRAKAQELEGAIIPLADTHYQSQPFLGLLLSGAWTPGSLQQLRSRGFSILMVPEDRIVRAFKPFGIDPRSDEDTAESEFARRIDIFGSLTGPQLQKITDALIDSTSADFKAFFAALETAITRKVASVRLFVVHGRAVDVATVGDAITFIENYNELEATDAGVHRYEIEIRYGNGNVVRGDFGAKKEALAFLRQFTA